MLFFKSIKKAMLLINIMYVVIGAYLIINKESGLGIVYIILASGLCLTGLFSMIRYFLIDIKDRVKREDFLFGSVLIAVGVVMYISRIQISYLSFVIFGISMLISALNKVQDMLDLKACGKNVIAFYSLLFIVGVGLGVMCMNAPFVATNFNYIVTGIGMIFSGLTDIMSNLTLAFTLYKFDKKNNEKLKENEHDELTSSIEEENNIEEVAQEDEEEKING